VIRVADADALKKTLERFRFRMAFESFGDLIAETGGSSDGSDA